MESNLKKVLIVDDEADILEIISYNLIKEGYEILTAKNGIEALEKVRPFKPNLVILDIMMPKMSGVEVCKILRS
ncbi:MAG TPA: response regulator, partial [Segetibacter sp.]|nr:response regulator [Segetibacter sp.]